MESKTILDGLRMNFRGQVGLEQEFDPFVVFREAFGFIPHLVGAQSPLPRVMTAHAKLEEAVCLRAGSIPRIHKERVLLSIAADRRDNYWVALDTELLTSLDLSEGHIDDLLNDYERAGLLALTEPCSNFVLG